MNTNIVANIIRSVQELWTDKFRMQFVWIFVLFFISAVLDLIGLASFVPLVMSFSDPEIISENRYFHAVYSFLGLESEQSFFLVFIISIFIFFTIKNLFGILVNRLQIGFAVRLSIYLADLQFKKYAGIKLFVHKEVGSGKVINYVNNTPFTYTTSIVLPLFNLLSEGVTFLIITLGVLFFNPVLFLLLVGFMGPVTFIFYRLIRNKSHHIGVRSNQLIPDCLNLVKDAFNGFIELRLYNKHDFYRKKYLEKQQEFQSLKGLSLLFTYMTPKVTEFIAVLGVVIIFGFGVVTKMSFTELLAIVAVFAGGAYRLMPSLNRIIASFISLKRYQYTIDNLFRHMGDEFNFSKEQNGVEVEFSSNIRCVDLTFSFPSSPKPIFNKVNLTINKGDRVGFKGPSGVGKTTLANLILGLFKPEGGQIQVDGIEINENNLESWYKRVGYVKQDGFIMDDSILMNITMGNANCDEQKAWQALKEASLFNFVKELPQGINTEVGEDGGNLSGGQRQRLSIARALYQGAELLVFDEATSALDAETEQEINQAIESLSRDKTILIIAHRLTTLETCNRIWSFGPNGIEESLV